MLLGAISLLLATAAVGHPTGRVAAPIAGRDVDLAYPYNGPEIPIGDPGNPTLDASKGGFQRIWQPPAVTPTPGKKVTNNINVISSALFPGGINIHFQTPYGIGGEPCVEWGEKRNKLKKLAKGKTTTYDRTPPCSLLDPTQCSQFFHDVRIDKLKPGTTYYYRIPGGNGTDPSQILDFTTARAAGDSTPFTVAVLADMGYTNAKNTHKHLVSAVQDGAAFVWHGGDISYADQWYAGILPCVLTGPDAWPLCYNGSETTTPLGKIGELPNDTTVNPEYYLPLPAGEQPIQGGPAGGDISTVYEINWDLWQQWMNQITKFSPYMVAPGNHEATCAEFDGPNNEVTAILENNEPPHIGMSAPKSTLNYYSCPPSQRNFTAYQHRFTMPGDVSGGVSNFWYSFDYGLAHFITFDGETDFPLSPEWTFEEELAKKNISGSHPTNRTQTYVTDSGPFGRVDGDFKVKESYEQYHWLKKDLESVDRQKTPWVIAMSHRPMYATEGGGYQSAMRSAFEDLFLENGVDLYLSGHIHYYERMLPLGKNYTLIHDAVKDEHTYVAKKGSVAHIVNGQAGQLEGPSVLKPGQAHANYSAFLDEKNWGFGKINVYNASVLGFEFVRATDGSLGDYLWLVKE